MKKRTAIAIVLLLCLGWLLSIPASAYDFDLTGYALNAKAAYVKNIETDRVVYRKNAEKKLSIASLTKIMTATCVLEHCSDLDEMITVRQELLAQIANTGLVTAGLTAGERMSVRNLLHCLLIISAADAALVLADYTGGSVNGFVAMMNDKAAALGLTDTHYVDPHGLHDMDSGNYSTAKDQATLCEYALRNETFASIVSAVSYTAPKTNMSGERQLVSTNYMLQRESICYYERARGVKTGYTKDAGRCLASTATDGETSYISIVLGCDAFDSSGKLALRHFKDSIFLFEDAFSNYEMKVVLLADGPTATVHVKCFGIDEDAVLVPEESYSYLLKTGESYRTQVSLAQEKISKPVEKGQVLGTCSIFLNDAELAVVNLVAANAVERSPGRMIRTIAFYLLIAFAVIALVAAIRKLGSAKNTRKTTGNKR